MLSLVVSSAGPPSAGEPLPGEAAPARLGDDVHLPPRGQQGPELPAQGGGAQAVQVEAVRVRVPGSGEAGTVRAWEVKILQSAKMICSSLAHKL